MVLSHLQRDYYERSGLLHGDDDPTKFKSEVSRLSLTCKRWSLVLRPYLFRIIRLQKRDDLRFLLTMVKSSLSGWLADDLLIVKIMVKGAAQPRLSSSFWKDLRENLPAVKTLQFAGESAVHDTLFPWRERISLGILTHIQAIVIKDFHFPSLSSLFRLLNSLPSLSLALLFHVKWPNRSHEFQIAPPRCLMSTSNAKTLLSSDCTDNRLFTWFFAGMSTRWVFPAQERRLDQFEGLSMPPAVSTIIGLVDKFFDEDDGILAVEIQDAKGKPPDAGHRVSVALTACIDKYAFCIMVFGPGGSDAKFSLGIVTVPPPASDEERDIEHAHEHNWPLHMIAFGFDEPSSFPELDPDEWATVDGLLSQSPYLHSLDLFCGNNVPKEGFNELVDVIRSELPSVGAKIRGWYGPHVSDGREMASELFGTGWRGKQFMQSISKLYGY